MNFFLREQPSLSELPVEQIEWEECNCLLCGSANWSPLVEGMDRSGAAPGKWFLVVQCHDCGLCFTNLRPSRRSIAQFYSKHYRPHQALAAEQRSECRRRGIWTGHWTDSRKVLPLRGEGRLLDFGCGSGSYLWRMHRQGWQVIGVDPSASAVDYVRQELGLPALVGSLPHQGLSGGCFDVITMWQSLEHVHCPMEVLRAARRLLARDGRLIVAVPNIDSLAFRWFGTAWIGLRFAAPFVPFRSGHFDTHAGIGWLLCRFGAHAPAEQLAAFFCLPGLPTRQRCLALSVLAQKQNHVELSQLVHLSDPPIRLHDGKRGSGSALDRLSLQEVATKEDTEKTNLAHCADLCFKPSRSARRICTDRRATSGSCERSLVCGLENEEWR